MTVWYRVDDRPISTFNEWDEHVSTRYSIIVREYRVSHPTPKGVRLTNGRFVAHSHVKKFAYPTLAEAKTSYLARKRKQISIYKARISAAERYLKIAETLNPETGKFKEFVL